MAGGLGNLRRKHVGKKKEKNERKSSSEICLSEMKVGRWRLAHNFFIFIFFGEEEK